MIAMTLQFDVFISYVNFFGKEFNLLPQDLTILISTMRNVLFRDVIHLDKRKVTLAIIKDEFRIVYLLRD